VGGTERRINREIEYRPLPSQKRFHASKARFKGFSGPIGSGKSQALCQEAIRLAYINKGRWGLLGAPTYPMLRDATQAALFEILDSNHIPYDHNKAENVLTLRDTKSRILFRPVDEFERLRGTNLAWFGLDELTYTQEGAWLRLEGRLRDPKATQLCGFAVWTPKGYDWVYKKFVTEKVAGYQVVMAKPRENQYLLEKTPDFYDQLRLSYDERFYKQEVLGEYLNMNAGKVYCNFDRELHVKETKVDVSKPIYWANDFNVDPMCSVVVQFQDDYQHVNVIDEIFLRDSSTQEATRMFLEKYGVLKAEIRILGDASGNQKQTTGATDYGTISSVFSELTGQKPLILTPPSNPSVRERIGAVNSKLKSALGVVQMTVDPKCTELVKDFEEVGYKESGMIDKDSNKLRTHLSDALGYAVWHALTCKLEKRVGHRSDGRVVG